MAMAAMALNPPGFRRDRDDRGSSHRGSCTKFASGFRAAAAGLTLRRGTSAQSALGGLSLGDNAGHSGDALRSRLSAADVGAGRDPPAFGAPPGLLGHWRRFRAASAGPVGS